ncbi:MAG TPA: sugar phosphate isomerase/epimerase [Clostridiales bacterium]|nr:sugar phosphate isomerase/epimerase [Clostridiales bacterium]
MRFGCCLNMLATQPDGIGAEHLQALAGHGFDYAELPLAQMMQLSDREFQCLAEKVAQSGIKCEACNNFFPRTMRLTGDDIDMALICAYTEKALARAASLGAEIAVFGSGAARSVPEGFAQATAWQQLVQLLRAMDPIAAKHRITLVIEPLRTEESNIINTFRDGCRLAGEAGCAQVKVLVDFYHLCAVHEPAAHVREFGRDYLRHVHFAQPGSRIFPADVSESEYDYGEFADALRSFGYDGRVSCEALTKDFDRAAPVALAFFRKVFQTR